MKTYKATVRVAKSGGLGTMVVWAQVQASDPYAARCQLEALYGRGSVVSAPVIAR
jgi:hypothetical protein